MIELFWLIVISDITLIALLCYRAIEVDRQIKELQNLALMTENIIRIHTQNLALLGARAPQQTQIIELDTPIEKFHIN